METVPFNVEPTVGRVISAVGAGAVTCIFPRFIVADELPFEVLDEMVTEYEPGAAEAGIVRAPL